MLTASPPPEPPTSSLRARDRSPPAAKTHQAHIAFYNTIPSFLATQTLLSVELLANIGGQFAVGAATPAFPSRFQRA